ncbi:TPA: hypothetical protein ACMDQP_003096 [Vibrio cholerae]
MTIPFNITPVEQIVDQYIAAFPKVDTVAIADKITSRAKAFEEGNASQYINIFDSKLQNVEKIDNTPCQNEHILMPVVTLTRVKGCTRWGWYQLIGDLLKAGYTISDDHNKYFGTNESVCLERPESFKEVNKALVEAMVSKAIEEAEKQAHSAYFDTDKIAQYVEQEQERERQQYLNRQKAVVDGLIAQKLQVNAAKNEFKAAFTAFVDGKTEVSFNDVKKALNGADNALVSELLTDAGYVKGKDLEGKTVWLKS